MSITVIQAIPTYSSAGNPMWGMVSGSQNSLSNYFYRFTTDVDQDLDGWDNASVVKMSKRPDNSWGVYDAHLVVRDYVRSPFYQTGDVDDILSETGITKDPAWVKFRVAAAEMTGSTAISSTVDITATGFAFLSRIKTNDFPSFAWSDYQVGSTSKKFITYSPRSLKIYDNDHAWLGFMHIVTSGASNAVKVKTYDSAGAALGEFDILNNYYSPGSNDSEKFLRLASGPYQLNQLTSGSVTVVSGSLPMITSGVASYVITVRRQTLGDVQISEAFTYTIEEEKCVTDNIRLHWLSRLGRIDSFNFPLASRRTIDVERKTHQKALGKVVGTTFGYTSADRGTTQYFSRETEKIHVTSDWLSTDEAAWLEELFVSNEVYYQPSVTSLVSVNIITDSIEIKKHEQDGLFLIEFDLQYSNANE